MTSAIARVARGWGWLMAAQAVLRFGNLLLLGACARLLPLPEYTAVSMALVYGGLWVPVLNFGLGILGVREIAAGKCRLDTFCCDAMPLKLVVSVVGCLVAVAMAMLLQYGNGHHMAIVLLLINATVVSLTEFFHIPFSASDRMGTTASLVSAERASGAIGGAIGLAVARSIEGVAVGLLAGGCVGLTLAVWFYRRHVGRIRPGFDWRLTRELTVAAVPIAGTWLLTMAVARPAVLVAERVVAGDVLAPLVTAYLIFVGLQIAFSALTNALLPVTAGIGAESHAEVATAGLKMASVTLAAGLVAATPVAHLSAPVLTLVLGAAVMPSPHVLAAVISIAVVFSASSLLGTCLLSVGDQRRVVAATAAGAVVSVAGALAIIPSFGIAGVLFVHAAGELTVLVAMGVAAKRRGALAGPLVYDAVAAAAGVALSAILSWPSWTPGALAAAAIPAIIFKSRMLQQAPTSLGSAH